MWSPDTGQWIPCFDSCQLIIPWMSNINVVPMVMVLLPYFSRYGTYGRTDVCTDDHVTTKIFQIKALPNFLRYGVPVTHLRRAGALDTINNKKNLHVNTSKLSWCITKHFTAQLVYHFSRAPPVPLYRQFNSFQLKQVLRVKNPVFPHIYRSENSLHMLFK